MRALTVEEARQRAADLAIRSYQVDFDLTGTGDTFVTTSRIRFGAASDAIWVDVKPTGHDLAIVANFLPARRVGRKEYLVVAIGSAW